MGVWVCVIRLLATLPWGPWLPHRGFPPLPRLVQPVTIKGHCAAVWSYREALGNYTRKCSLLGREPPCDITSHRITLMKNESGFPWQRIRSGETWGLQESSVTKPEGKRPSTALGFADVNPDPLTPPPFHSPSSLEQSVKLNCGFVT